MYDMYIINKHMCMCIMYTIAHRIIIVVVCPSKNKVEKKKKIEKEKIVCMHISFMYKICAS